MVKERYKKHILLTSAVLAIVIFLAGVLLGWSFDHFRVNSLLESTRVNELSTESYLVEQEFFNHFAGGNCELAQIRINSLSNELRDIGQKLVSFQDTDIFEDTNFDYMRRKYFLLEIKTYTLVDELKKECGTDTSVVLFFYGVNDKASENQGYVLDRLVLGGRNLIVFSFDAGYDGDPTLKAFKLYYNITKTPTLVINDKIKRDGFVGFEDLKTMLGD